MTRQWILATMTSQLPINIDEWITFYSLCWAEFFLSKKDENRYYIVGIPSSQFGGECYFFPKILIENCCY